MLKGKRFTAESSARDKKVIFTGERGENMADYLAVNQPRICLSSRLLFVRVGLWLIKIKICKDRGEKRKARANYVLSIKRPVRYL